MNPVSLGTTRTMLLTLLRGRLHIGLSVTGVVLVLLAGMLQELSVGETVRSFTSVSLAIHSLVVDVTVIAAALALCETYLTGRAAIPWLSRPVSRTTFYASGMAALVITALLASGFLVAPIGIVIAVYEGPVARVIAAAVVGGLEAVVAGVLAAALRIRFSTVMTVTVTLAVVLIGRLGLLIAEMADKGVFGIADPVVRAVQLLMPRLWLLDWTAYALSQTRPMPPLWEVVTHTVLYCAAVVIVGLRWHRQADFSKDSE